MSKRNLGILYSRFYSRTERLAQSFSSTFPSRPVHVESCHSVLTDGREREIMKLQLYWGQFCQELIIKSVAGGHQTLTGKPLVRGTITNTSDILKEASRLCGGTHFPWHMPNRCSDLAKNVGATNYNQIKAGLSITAPVADLIVIRNYIAHPSKQNQIAYKRVAIKYGKPKTAPTDLLSSRLPNGDTLFDFWVKSFRLMAEVAVR